MAGIIISNEDEVARRQSKSPDYIASGVADPIRYIEDLLSRIADEAGIVSRFEVDTKGKGAIRFAAVLDTKKLRAMRLNRPRG